MGNKRQQIFSLINLCSLTLKLVFGIDFVLKITTAFWLNSNFILTYVEAYVDLSLHCFRFDVNCDVSHVDSTVECPELEVKEFDMVLFVVFEELLSRWQQRKVDEIPTIVVDCKLVDLSPDEW